MAGSLKSQSRGRLRWRLNRMKAMSATEVGFRLSRRVRTGLERAGLGWAEPYAPAGVCGAPWTRELPHCFDPSRYCEAADRILAGSYDIFSLHELELGFPPRWNVDPKTGIEAPLAFGKAMDYRLQSAGDVKYLWELNRHLELVTLAQAWHLTARERYAEGCRELLESWFRECPYPRGLNWCVSLEPAVRLVNWSFAWFLLGADDSELFHRRWGQDFRQRWLTAIYQHCHFIAGHWSRHSSANNHLLGEAAGLFIGAVTWPLWPESDHWRDQAQSELAREALEQTYPDGVNKEQALWYHHAVADMLLIAGLFARANRLDFGDEYWKRLEAMLVFIASVMDVGGNTPAFGDADEGMLVRFVPQRISDAPTDVFRSLLATGAVLFQRRDLRYKAGVFDDKSRWLLGDAAQSDFDALETSQVVLPPRRAFKQGGYFILGEEFETPREVRVVADAGPLGYLSIAAHGHADALSFTLSAAGKPMLVDSGTFSYRASERWRRYFRGTSAHNTLKVDGRDQSEFAGSFLWLAHANTTVDALDVTADIERLTARHDGYGRLEDPVVHRRTWRYHPGKLKLTVTDELLCAGSHSIELYWHFSPQCQVMQHGNAIIAQRDGVVLILNAPGGLTGRLVRASEQPPLGWFSSAFDVRAPTTTAVFAALIQGDTSLRSDIQLQID